MSKMTPAHADRFARHFRFLQQVPDGGFDMLHIWSATRGRWDSKRSPCLHPPADQNASCGTAACWLGWLPVCFPDSWVVGRGTDVYGDPSSETVPTLRISDDEIGQRAFTVWEQRGRIHGDDERANWATAKAQLDEEINQDRVGMDRILGQAAYFFGTTFDDVVGLTMPHRYASYQPSRWSSSVIPKSDVLDRMVLTAKAYGWDISGGVAQPS